MKDAANDFSKKCPSAFELSEWMDSEGDSGNIAAHLGNCPKCRQTVASYEQVDAAVQVLATPPPGLAERIKERCRQEKDVPIVFPLWRKRWQYAAAAAFVALLTLSGVLWKNGNNGMQEQSIVRSETTEGTQADAVKSEVATIAEPLNSADESAPVAEKSLAGGKNIPTNRLVVPVGLRVGGGTSLQSYYDWNDTRPSLVVPSRVQHVWLTDDVAKARDTFFQNLPVNSRYVDGVRRTDGGNYRVTLSDKNLQELVDKLSSSGLVLLSPTVPQPGYGNQLVTTGKVVTYNANFVKQ